MDLPERFIHQATRYVLGRSSYAVSEHCDWLIANWDNIPLDEKALIVSDVEQAFRHERGLRSSRPDAGYSPLGMEMDKRDWERVRALWEAR